MDITQIITVGVAAIIAAVSGLITGIMATRANAHKGHAEARQIEAATDNANRSADIAALQCVLDDLSKRYERRSAQYDEDVKDLESRITKLEGERDAYITSARGLQNELSKANARITELTSRVNELRTELERKNHELDAKNKELAEKNKEIEDYQSRLSLAISEVDRARKDSGRL